MKISIRSRIQLYFVILFSVIFAFTITFISIKTKRNTYDLARNLIESQSQNYSNQIKSEMDIELGKLRTLSQSFLTYKDYPFDEFEPLVISMFKEIALKNPEYLSVWDSWELNAIDTTYKKTYGRITNIVRKAGSSVILDKLYKNLDGDKGTYMEIKTKKKESLSEPYFHAYTGGQQILMSSLVVPILDQDKFVGVVGLDFTMKRFQEIVSSIKTYDDSKAFLVSNKGVIVGHENSTLVGKTLLDELNENILSISEEELDEKRKQLEKITKKIQLGEAVQLEDNHYFTLYTPIPIGNSSEPWSLAIQVPLKIVFEKAREISRISILIGIISVLIVSGLIYWLINLILNPINKITFSLNQLAKGNNKTQLDITYTYEDELHEMIQALKKSIQGLTQKTEFAEEIGKNNLNHKLEVLSEEDNLGKSLIKMRDNLLSAKEEERKRKIEDEKRRWINEGLAKFSDLLHSQSDNLQDFSYAILSNLIKYLNVNQGGVFLYNDDDKDQVHFELVASYAFNRRKFKEKRILYGEGLIGTCALEKQTIYLKEIPESYIEITSGLGKRSPNNLILVPLKKEDEVLGILELASFDEIEPYKIEFIEKIAENFAATMAAVKVKIRTNQLLERTQQQAEEMAAQEEEMRQNLEELQATQEESARKTAEMESLLNGLTASGFIMEYNLNRKITYINSRMLHFLGIDEEDVIDTYHSDGLNLSESQKKAYDNFWNELKRGEVKTETHEIEVKGKNFRFFETFIPIKNQNDEVIKILKISNDITHLS